MILSYPPPTFRSSRHFMDDLSYVSTGLEVMLGAKMPGPQVDAATHSHFSFEFSLKRNKTYAQESAVFFSPLQLNEKLYIHRMLVSQEDYTSRWVIAPQTEDNRLIANQTHLKHLLSTLQKSVSCQHSLDSAISIDMDHFLTGHRCRSASRLINRSPKSPHQCPKLVQRIVCRVSPLNHGLIGPTSILSSDLSSINFY